MASSIVFGGMNLPMALNALVMKDMLPNDEFITMILTEAKNAVQEFKTDISDEEDDDI